MWQIKFIRMAAADKSAAAAADKPTSQAKLCKDIIRCVNYAAIKHKDQRRDDEQQTPYVNHPIGVAYILVHEGGISDVSIIQAALLLGTIEEANTSFYELQVEFGGDISCLVRELTVDKSLPKLERRRQQMDRTAQVSNRAKIISLARELSLLRELRRSIPLGWSKEEVQEHFEWAAMYVSQMFGTNLGIESSLRDLFLERGIIMT